MFGTDPKAWAAGGLAGAGPDPHLRRDLRGAIAAEKVDRTFGSPARLPMDANSTGSGLRACTKLLGGDDGDPGERSAQRNLTVATLTRGGQR